MISGFAFHKHCSAQHNSLLPLKSRSQPPSCSVCPLPSPLSCCFLCSLFTSLKELQISPWALTLDSAVLPKWYLSVLTKSTNKKPSGVEDPLPPLLQAAGAGDFLELPFFPHLHARFTPGIYSCPDTLRQSVQTKQVGHSRFPGTSLQFAVL